MPPTLVLRLGLSIFLAMNMMAFTGFFYAREVYDPATSATAAAAPLAGLLAYLLMLLCTVVVVLLGTPLMLDAMGNCLRGPRRRIDANLLIVMGVAAAYLLSVIHTLRGHGGLYFDTAAMILVLVALGHAFDAVAKRRATASLGDLVSSIPDRAWVRRGEGTVEVSTDLVRVGEAVRARAGERLAVDGRIIEGRSHVDESSLTGESNPRPVGPGDRVMAGGVNIDGQLWVETTAVGGGRTLAQVQRLLDEARLKQAPIQGLADRIAAVFVPLVVATAAAVFAWHAWNGEATRGLLDGLSVLLISCPCALGLATPLATWSALGRAAKMGVLIDSGATLERAAAVGVIFLDKTGTLTQPRLTVARIDAVAGTTPAEALHLAASVESASLHPVAGALLEEANRLALAPATVTQARTLPGLGVEGVVAGRRLALGGLRLAHELKVAIDLPQWSTADDNGATIEVYLMEPPRVLARFRLGERLGPDAALMVDELRRMGLAPRLLTGDQPGPARRVAEELGLEFEAGLLPADKLDRLTRARLGLQRGRTLAMVGDGINDAPVLAGADVGIAVGSASDLAKEAGNIRLVSPRLDRIPLALAIARHAMRRIRLNLLWSFGYNTVGIALAAAGLLNPIFAATAMFGSSLFIILCSRGAGRVPAVAEFEIKHAASPPRPDASAGAVAPNP